MEVIITVLLGIIGMVVGIAIMLSFDTSCEALSPAPRGQHYED